MQRAPVGRELLSQGPQEGLAQLVQVQQPEQFADQREYSRFARGRDDTTIPNRRGLRIFYVACVFERLPDGARQFRLRIRSDWLRLM